MCMGFAKDINAWACQTELARREDSLSLWGALLRQGEPDDDVSAQLRTVQNDLTCGSSTASASPRTMSTVQVTQ